MTDAFSHSFPFPDVLKDTFPALLIELSYTIFLNFSLVAETKRPLYLELYRQSMGIPSCLAWYVVTFHCLVAANNILEQSSQHMVNPWATISCRRAFIKGKMRCSLSHFYTFIKNVMLAPKMKDMLLYSRKIWFTTHLVEHGSASFQRNDNFSACTFPYAVSNDIRMIG